MSNGVPIRGMHISVRAQWGYAYENEQRIYRRKCMRATERTHARPARAPIHAEPLSLRERAQSRNVSIIAEMATDSLSNLRAPPQNRN